MLSKFQKIAPKKEEKSQAWEGRTGGRMIGRLVCPEATEKLAREELSLFYGATWRVP